MNFVFKCLSCGYFWIAIALIILFLYAMRKNDNYFDIRNIFVEQYKLFESSKGQLFIFYVIPAILSFGTVLIKIIDDTLIGNIVVVISIIVAMLFAMLSILSTMTKSNDNYKAVLCQTYNTVMFEVVLCIFALLTSFVRLFAGNTGEITSYIISFVLYYLIYTIILHIFIIIKRMKALFNHSQ